MKTKVRVYLNQNGVAFWKGSKVSDYGMENGYLDYKCLANTFNHVPCMNNIFSVPMDEWELVNGFNPDYLEEEDAYPDEDLPEVFQWFIIDSNGADTLCHFTNEQVWYNSNLDLYVWGVTHFGTAWDYVLTNIEIEDVIE